MPYDLYGTYYESARDAENAEMAQCAEIDTRHLRKEISQLQEQVNYETQQDQSVWLYIEMLEQRIKALEDLIVIK